MEGLLARERREMKPFLLKAGIALALSLAGYFFSQIRSRQAAGHRRRRPSLPPPGESEGARKGGAGLKEELRLMKYEEASPKFTGSTITIAIAGLSPMSRNSGDEEGYLLPEFNELVQKEFESTGKEPGTPSTHTSTPKRVENKEESEMEQEIVKLRNMVQSLQERERNLEFQLLEYYGLKEQEAAVRELENRLKINAMEAKLFSLKIESLQAENRRLEAQVSDYSRVMAELEAARAKIKLRKKKSRSDSEQAMEKMAALHERVAALEDSEYHDREHDEDFQQSLKRLNDLEEEAVALRNENLRLAQENSELTKKLESSQSLVPTALETAEAAEALEEVNRLRERNEELAKELEQLQTDHCGDVEEMVYLKWVNACLRYELRNYQPPGGKTVARDLSKTLSPKSEEKAKLLIHEYANSGNDEKMLMDFDSERCSSSQSSSLTETGELDDTSSTMNSTSSSKKKFFSKLKKLVLGKESHSNRYSQSDRTSTSFSYSGRRASISNCSLEDLVGRYSYDSTASCITMDRLPENHLLAMDGKADEDHRDKSSWNNHLSRTSLDVQKLRLLCMDETREAKGERSKSEVGSSYGYKRLVLGGQNSIDLPQNEQLRHETVDSTEKVELKKFTGALKSTHRSPQFHRRSESFNLF